MFTWLLLQRGRVNYPAALPCCCVEPQRPTQTPSGRERGPQIKARLCGQEAPSLLRWNVAVADFKDFLLLAWTSSPYRPGPAPPSPPQKQWRGKKKNHSWSAKHLEIFKIKTTSCRWLRLPDKSEVCLLNDNVQHWIWKTTFKIGVSREVAGRHIDNTPWTVDSNVCPHIKLSTQGPSYTQQ